MYRILITHDRRVHTFKRKPNLRSPGFAATLWIIASLSCVYDGAAQQSVSKNSAVMNYVNPSIIATPARFFLMALGDRIQRPGKERTTLTGKYTDRSATTDVIVVWEVPGRFRFGRSDKPGRPLIYDDKQGWNSPGAIALDETGAMETLFDDTAESFFYASTQGAVQRFLGNRFRAANGKTPNYKGPWYDVYQVFMAVHSPQGTLKRPKMYAFDSQTGLLSRVEYMLPGSVAVSSEFTGWSRVNGQAIPTNVVRKENGQVVLTVSFTSASVGPTASDGIFPGH